MARPRKVFKGLSVKRSEVRTRRQRDRFLSHGSRLRMRAAAAQRPGLSLSPGDLSREVVGGGKSPDRRIVLRLFVLSGHSESTPELARGEHARTVVAE